MMVFLHKICTQDDWRVSFTRPWAVFTRLGRPDEWLVRQIMIKAQSLFLPAEMEIYYKDQNLQLMGYRVDCVTHGDISV